MRCFRYCQNCFHITNLCLYFLPSLDLYCFHYSPNCNCVDTTLELDFNYDIGAHVVGKLLKHETHKYAITFFPKSHAGEVRSKRN